MILHDASVVTAYTEQGLWGERTLLDLLAENRAACPDRTAIVDPPNRRDLVGDEPRELTWAQLGAAVDAVAARLAARGVGGDEVVVIQLPNVWELAVVCLAVAAAGGVPSPVPVQWRGHELGHVAATTDARIYVGSADFKGFDHLAMARGLGERSTFTELIGLAEITEQAASGESPPPVGIGANDIFSICWTSGTEAGAKGCPLSHNNWLYLSGTMARVLGLENGDRMLCPAPLVNMTGFGVLLVPWLMRGGTLVLHHPLDMEILVDQLTSRAIQFTILVPAMLNMIVKHPRVDELDLTSVRTVATGSAPPSAHAMEEFKTRWGIEISNLWGQNEGTAIIGGPADVPELERRVDHLPWWGREGCDWPSGAREVSVKLVSDDGGLCTEPGEVGELAYRGPGVFPGYFRRPDLNDKAFDDEGYFYTGDLFRIQDGCHLAFFDRKKDIIIRGGFNISAAEVENLALAHEAVADAAAIAVPDERLGERVCLCLVPADPGHPPSLQTLTDFMREKGVAAYKLPEAVMTLSEIPRNPVGKIVKSELRDRARSEAARS